MSRFAQRAILAFDSDEAGARAAERAFAFQEAYPVQAVVMIMPQGLDPADFVRVHGAEAVHLAAKHGRPLVEYMLRRTIGRHDLSTVEGQSAAVASVMPILQRLTDPVRRSEYGHMVADLAGVAEHSVLATMDQHGGAPRPAEVAKALKRGTVQERVEREMLKLLVRDADIYRELEPSSRRTTSVRQRRGMPSWAIRDGGGDVAALAGGADEKLAATVSSLAVEPLDGEGDDGLRRARLDATARVPAEGPQRRAAHAPAEAQSHDRAGVRRLFNELRHDRRRAAAPASRDARPA